MVVYGIENNGVNMVVSPNDIIFSVHYANGDTCSKSFVNIATDIIRTGEIDILKVGSELKGTLGGLESWRAWRNWPHTVTKSCHSSCMPNWCLEDEDPTTCFPSGIYVLEHSTQDETGRTFTLYISRRFDASTVISTCSDILTSTPYLGTDPTCSYDQSDLTLTVQLGNGYTVAQGDKICIDPTKAAPAGVLTTNNLNCIDVGFIYTALTATSQVGNRFYFTFDRTPLTPVINCDLVNVGLGLLGTSPSCTSETNILTIESNLTDSTYKTSDTIGISDIITNKAETLLVVDNSPPSSLTGNITPNSGEWDSGVDGNKWEGVLTAGSTLTLDKWTWSKVSGPAITFSPDQAFQSYNAQTLVLGGSYVVSVIVNFTNAPWLTLTYEFTVQKMNFEIISNTQSGENFTIVLSDSRADINSCDDIFDASTVTKLGATATCANAGTSTLQVHASTDHNMMVGETLVYKNDDLMSTTTNYILLEPNVYINTGASLQIGNKFTVKLSRKLDPSTEINNCVDIVSESGNLGTDSICSYDEATFTLTIYVGNGHSVISGSKLCIDPTKASPARVLTTTDINCLVVSIDLPTVTITTPIDDLQQYSYVDPITITTSTANLTNVGSYTLVFQYLSGPTSYNGFSATNESSKIIPATSLLPGTYIFRVYLHIADSGAFAPNHTLTIQTFTSLASKYQIGNRFYFTFYHSLSTPVINCDLVNVGLGLFGTSPSCTSETNILTIKSNLTDSTYKTSDTIGISNIITNKAETLLVVDNSPPSSLTGNITPNSGEWDSGVDGNKWEGVLTAGSTLTLDKWTWSKVSGPAITFSPDQAFQSYNAQTLVLGGSYVVSVIVNFTNAPWLTLTYEFTVQKMNFEIISNTQSGENFTIVLSDSRADINSCDDIFDASTVTKLGATATCANAGTSTLQVHASTDHNMMVGETLVYKNDDLMSTTTNYILLEPNVYINTGASLQIGNKFTVKLSRKLDPSTEINNCVDIVSESGNLGTDSICSYDEATFTLTIYVGNGHSVISGSKLCIDPTKASPARVLTTTDINCLVVSIDLPTVTITTPIDDLQQYSYVDPITITTSTANLTNVGSYTLVFQYLSGPTSYNGFSATNESSKIIPATSLLPGTYIFRVYLHIADSGAFAPNHTLTIQTFTSLASKYQIGNRFYFTFYHSLSTPVINCDLVNVGLGLFGTSPSCTSETNILTIKSNLTDSTYKTSDTIGISDILTAHVETLLVVDNGPPSLTGNITPNSGEWDSGVDGNYWEISLEGSTLTLDKWTWSKVSGPAITFSPDQAFQSYNAQTLVLGGSYVVSVIVNFTNAPWLTLTYEFTVQKMNFEIISNTQSGENFTIVLSDSRADINSCDDIFDASTVTKLGATATCANAGTSTLQVHASTDHNMMVGETLVYKNDDLMSTTTNYILLEPNVYINTGASLQIGNKFTVKLSRKLDPSTEINNCVDIVSESGNLGTDSICSYDEATFTLTIYVGNGHSVISGSKLCIDPTKASPARVLTTTDINCLVVSIDLPTVTITTPIDDLQQYSYVDPITITTSTANLTNVGSYTLVFQYLSGPTSYNGFSATNESSKIIPATSLLPGTYIFRVYLHIADSGAFAPNHTLTIQTFTSLASKYQIGNRFYFTFYHSLPTPVINCDLVNVGLGLFGTSPSCTSETNILTIKSNLTDSTYKTSDTIGISDILTAHEESLIVVDNGPPSLTAYITPNSVEWDSGVGGNKWEIALEGSTLTVDEWTWTKISGPTISFTPNQSTQSYIAEALILGASYELSVTANFTNADWITLTHQFASLKMNFGVESNTQSESKFTIVLSDSRVVINSCGDIFDINTVTNLGENASCTYNSGSKVLIVYASGDHSLNANPTIVYDHSDLMSTTPDFVLGNNLPSASVSITGGLDCSVENIITINTANIGSITAPQITYQFIYVSGPFTSYIFPNIDNNISTIPSFTLLIGNYEMKIVMIIADYNDYTYYHSQSFNAQATKIDLVHNGPKFNITLNMEWPEIINSCNQFFEADSLTLLTADVRCVRDENKKSCLYVYAGNTSIITTGDTLELNSLYFINNTMTSDSMPIFNNITLSDPTKHWYRDQVQNVSLVLTNFNTLDTYFNISYEYFVSGESSKNITGDSSSTLGTFQPLDINTAGEHSLMGVVTLTDNWGEIAYYQMVTNILVALPPFPSATGLNASYPQVMLINFTSNSTLDMDTNTKSENLTYIWEIFTDEELSVSYSPWTIKTSENVSIAVNYFPLGIYHVKLTVNKWIYFTSWTKGVLNISNSNTKLEISSPNLANLRSDAGSIFEASTLSLDGSTDFSIYWDITNDIYNRYQLGGFLTVPENTFIPGGLYILRCKILGNNERRELGRALPEIAIKMKVAKTINMGALLINPMVGDGLTTEFNLDANTFLDPSGKPLKYRFAYQIIGATSENWFRGWDYSNKVSAIKIPPGKDVFYNTVEIKVQAKNADNSTALMRKNITVKPIEIADKSAFVDDYLETANNPGEKLAAVASTAFLVEVDVNYAEPDACGGCDPDHGTCNSLTQLCVCNEGFKLSSLCNIPDDEKNQIAEVADTLAISTYIYIYIYIYSTY